MVKSIRFPDSLAAAFQARADELDRSFSWVVLRELEKALDAGERSERERMPAVARPGPASSRAPVDVAQSVERPFEARQVGGSTPPVHTPMFKCRYGDHRAKSPKAQCPNHAGALVPE